MNASSLPLPSPPFPSWIPQAGLTMEVRVPVYEYIQMNKSVGKTLTCPPGYLRYGKQDALFLESCYGQAGTVHHCIIHRVIDPVCTNTGCIPCLHQWTQWDVQWHQKTLSQIFCPEFITSIQISDERWYQHCHWHVRENIPDLFSQGSSPATLHRNETGIFSRHWGSSRKYSNILTLAFVIRELSVITKLKDRKTLWENGAYVTPKQKKTLSWGRLMEYLIISREIKDGSPTWIKVGSLPQKSG